MGLRLGLSGGVRHQLTPFSSINLLACFEVCFGSLSCIKRCSGSVSIRNGIRVLCRMLQYKMAFMIPSKMQILVAPCRLIPAQT